MSHSKNQALERVQHLESIIEKLEEFADPVVQAYLRELVPAMMDFHAEGLAHILDRLGQAGEAGQAIMTDLAGDDAVSGLLLLYGLHPLDEATRIRQALEGLRPALEPHGGQVELVRVAADTAHVRFQGGCDGCHTSSQALVHMIEEAILAAAPEVSAVHVEGAVPRAPTTNGRLALPLVQHV